MQKFLILFSSKNLFLLVIALIAHSFVVLVMSWSAPIVDMYGFRQSQTALSSYWLIHDGFSFAYETPVVGAPWSIPFEFPVYQLLAAFVSQTGLTLDFSGRIVSYVFFIACLWPLRSLAYDLRLGEFWFFATATMFLASPIYIFWGRSFMIETTALFFSMAHFSLLIAFLCRGGATRVIIAGLFGTLGVLAKSTTLPVFSLLAGFFALYCLLSNFSTDYILGRLRMWVPFGAALLIPYPIAISWISFTDMVKSQNTMGQALTSDALSAWNYGALDLRFSETLWVDTILQRAMPDIIGVAGTTTLIIFLALQIFPKIHVRLTYRQAVILAFSILGFFFPILIFTNLHVVHSYYQIANAIFLIAAIGVISSGLSAAGRPFTAFVVVILVVISQLSFFHTRYFDLATSTSTNSHYLIGLEARELTPSDSALMIFGVDWNSTVAYYSERKSFTAPNWAGVEQVEVLVANLASTLGGLKLGGVIVCGNNQLTFQDVVDSLIEERDVLATAGSCTLYEGNLSK